MDHISSPTRGQSGASGLSLTFAYVTNLHVCITGTTILSSYGSCALGSYDDGTSPKLSPVISAEPEVDAASLLPPTVLSN
jgi:hypothetical protein